MKLSMNPSCLVSLFQNQRTLQEIDIEGESKRDRERREGERERERRGRRDGWLEQGSVRERREKESWID